jgi:hypothetical protein
VVSSGSDFLIPRRRHVGAKAPAASNSRALASLEERHAGLNSAYEDLHWSLGSVIKWIAGRTPEAVDRLSIDEVAAEEAVDNLQPALERGEMSATASTAVDPIPRPLSPDTLARYEVCLWDDGHLLWPRVIHDTTEQEDLLNIRFSRADVIRNWPPAAAPEAVAPSTSGKEAACRAWLAQMMRDEPNRPRVKNAVWTEVSQRFAGLAKRGFDRAWSRAIEDTQAARWRSPGRRS